MRLLPRLEAADQLHGGGALGSRAPGAPPGLVVRPLLPPRTSETLCRSWSALPALGAWRCSRIRPTAIFREAPCPRFLGTGLSIARCRISTPPSNLLRPNLLHRPRAYLVRHRKPPISFLLGPAISQKRCRSRKPLERNTKAPPLWT